MARKTTLPQTPLQLRAWIKGTKQGRELLRELTEEAFQESHEEKCRACENIRPYPKVLVVLRRLGHHPGVEVYAEEGVSVRFLELPEMPDDVESLVEEYIEARLPKNWRCLLGLPAKRIRSDVFRGVSLAETMRHTERATALGDIREIDVTLTKEK